MGLRQSNSSKDHVEHLRTIHFTIVTVSFALLVVVSSRRPADIQIAHEQIKDLLNLRQNWIEHELTAQADRQVQSALDAWKSERQIFLQLKKTPERLKSSALLYSEPFLAEFRFGDKVVGRQWFEFGHPNWVITTLGRGGIAGRVFWKPFPSIFPASLRNFRTMWDNMFGKLTIRIPVKLAPELYVLHYERSPAGRLQMIIQEFTWTLARDTQAEGEKLEGEFVISPTHEELANYLRAQGKEVPQLTYHGMLETSYEIILPIVDHLELQWVFDYQGILLSRIGGSHWKRGLFENSFRELETITKDYQEIDMVVIERILANEKDRTRERVNVFGVNIPAEGTTRWGIFMLIALQIYFWLHVKALAARLYLNDPAWDVAWIGLYDAWWARCFFVASSSVLPFLVAVSLTWAEATKLSKQKEWIVVSVLMAALSLGLSIAVIKAWKKLWHEASTKKPTWHSIK